ncbi:MAG: zinc ABC transporter substrate-binding protein [Terrimicrobiaceae bacterium]|nr:zinc ABC transporter substrate-binding protein [Terrimicrobiaceae bacterium]
MKTFGIFACGFLLVSGIAWAEPLRVVATTGMVADMVRNVGGDRVEVTALIGEGVDPHLFKPTRDDVARLLKAQAIFANGLKLEGRLEDTFQKVAARGIPVHSVGQSIPADRLIAEGNHPDPHIWMDPALWAECIAGVRDALVKVDPEGTATYGANATRYAAELAELDSYVRRVIASIPKEQRVLITAHDAFHYLSRATGLEVLGIQGISTESEAGVSDINRLVDEVVNRKIPAIFVETSVPDKNVRAVLEGAAARGFQMKMGGELFSDAMGPAGTYEGTYMGMIDHNATTIARALGGEAPPGGLHGRLNP